MIDIINLNMFLCWGKFGQAFPYRKRFSVDRNNSVSYCNGCALGFLLIFVIAGSVKLVPFGPTVPYCIHEEDLWATSGHSKLFSSRESWLMTKLVDDPDGILSYPISPQEQTRFSQWKMIAVENREVGFLPPSRGYCQEGFLFIGLSKWVRKQ